VPARLPGTYVSATVQEIRLAERLQGPDRRGEVTTERAANTSVLSTPAP